MKRAPCFRYVTGTIIVRPEALPALSEALEVLAGHAHRHEPGTRLCAWFQDRTDPTRILRIAVFDDERAEQIHDASPAAQRLTRLLESVAIQVPAVREWTPMAGI
jgi:quinol monooxygenase YgiN